MKPYPENNITPRMKKGIQLQLSLARVILKIPLESGKAGSSVFQRGWT